MLKRFLLEVPWLLLLVASCGAMAMVLSKNPQEVEGSRKIVEYSLKILVVFYASIGVRRWLRHEL